MNWLILFAHAFNPLLLIIGAKDSQQDEDGAKEEPFVLASASVLTSFIAYLLWLGAHYLVIEISGGDFNYDEFIGAGKGLAYFLPFVMGAVILIIDYLIVPALGQQTLLALLESSRTLLLFLGGYFMLINYLAWIAG